MRRGFTLLELLIVIVVVGVLAAMLVPGFRSNREKARRTQCANNLRQFGLAAIQYADDKRFLPHNRKLSELDGDGMNGTSNHQTKIVRALLWYGYHDTPGAWVCPSSDDGAGDREVASARTWSWHDGSKGSATESPFVHDADDPPLTSTTELSYGWTRKGEGG
jgi:prepilin-type N-terminal cleavage/methylation domain-containing protein